ncbi:hypothetical protein TURU_058879 [Turdus rufiventris]|nr:hypothetical protein TURU_058879 [Turdus rufiventris]
MRLQPEMTQGDWVGGKAGTHRDLWSLGLLAERGQDEAADGGVQGLRDDNNAMEIGVDRELSRATGEAMNFQGNTVHLDNVSNSEELDLILLLVLMTVKPNGMNLNGLSSTHILWETSAVK